MGQVDAHVAGKAGLSIQYQEDTYVFGSPSRSKSLPRHLGSKGGRGCGFGFGGSLKLNGDVVGAEDDAVGAEDMVWREKR